MGLVYTGEIAQSLNIAEGQKALSSIMQSGEQPPSILLTLKHQEKFDACQKEFESSQVR
jgi:hypothetical protein